MYNHEAEHPTCEHLIVGKTSLGMKHPEFWRIQELSNKVQLAVFFGLIASSYLRLKVVLLLL
jgi:hypothetical protein